MEFLLSAFNFISHLSVRFIEIALIAAAIAFYVYAFFNVSIPKFIVAPVVSILLMFATYLYTQQKTTDEMQAQCDLKFNQAQQLANDKQLQAAAQINDLQNKYDGAVIELNASKIKQAQELEEALKRPTFDNPTGTPPDVDIPPMSNTTPQVIIDANSCLNSRIPSNVLRALH